MPVRRKPKNLHEATRYPYFKQTGILTNTDSIGHDMDNNSYLSWSNAAGDGAIEGMRVDASNRLRVGNAVVRSTPKPITWRMNANGSIGDQCMFIADQAYEFLAVYEIHSTAGTHASAVTLDITKDISGVAPGAGVSLLSRTINLKSTANTLNSAGPATVSETIQIAAGDRISVNFTGTLTDLAGVVVTVFLIPGMSGDSAIFAMNANAGLVDQFFYTATKNMKITGIQYVHSAAGTHGSAVTLQVKKNTSTNAPGTGTDLLTNNTNAGFDCKGTINVVQTGALSATGANLRLAPGDRLSVDFTGTLTALAGVVLVVTFEPLYETIEVMFNMASNSELVDQSIFIANRPYKVIAISEVHSTAGNDGGAVNLQVTVDRVTDAPGTGSDLISLNANAGFNLKGTANTVQNATFVSDGLCYLYNGDRLALDFAGTVTTLAGVQVTATLQLA